MFGTYIYNYITYKAVSKRAKIGSMLFLWLGLSVSILLIENWIVRSLLLLVGFSVSIHLITLKTIKNARVGIDETKRNEQERA